MLVLRNSKDSEIHFTNVDLVKRHYMFSKKDIEDLSRGLSNDFKKYLSEMIKNYNNDLKSCVSMHDIANVLNHYNDETGNESIFSVDEI